jgi:hypothetical protein
MRTSISTPATVTRTGSSARADPLTSGHGSGLWLVLPLELHRLDARPVVPQRVTVAARLRFENNATGVWAAVSTF